jgi:hypothetical protein
VADGIGGEGGDRVAESYDHKKAWFSINSEILSDLYKMRTESLQEMSRGSAALLLIKAMEEPGEQCTVVFA